MAPHRDSDAYANVDSDTSNTDLVKGVNWNQNNHFMSQELRLNGVSGRVDRGWSEPTITPTTSMLTGNCYTERILGPISTCCMEFPRPFFRRVGDQSRYFKQDGEGWALFTHNIVELTDNFDLVVGFRWSDDQKDATAKVVNDAVHCTLAPFIPYCPVPDLQQSRGEDEPSGTIKLVRNLDIGNIYIGYSRGFKAGGFNLDRDAATTGFEFEPETVDSYEAGLKWAVPDRTFEANTALFYSEFQNYQINEFDGISFATTNAAQVNSTGAELELVGCQSPDY
ncbi:MAG: TonB-dependent receptor [Halioglobus sp.]